MRSKSDWSLQSSAASSAFILAGGSFPSSALRDAQRGETPPCEIPFFPLPVHLLLYLWGHQPFRGVFSTPAGTWAGQCWLAGPCCADRALHNPCSRCQPISQPISPQLQLLPNLCKGRSSDFSCDIFVGSPGGCRQPSQTVT